MVASIWQPGGSNIAPTANGTGTITERFVATSGQTLISFTKFIYTLGVDALEVNVNGSLQTLTLDYTETSISSITLLAPLVAGDTIVVIATLNVTQLVTTNPTAALGGVSISNITMDHNTVNGQILYTNTNPAGWNTGVGRMSLDVTIVTNGYFAANPNGHFVFILRQDPALVATAARGQGIGIGNLSATLQPSDLVPTSMLETWYNGIGAGAYLWPHTDTARSLGLQDGLTYRYIIDSTKTNDGNRYLRYRCYRVESDGTYTAMVDSGDVLDHNTGADLTQSALLFGHAFESNLSVWSISYSNIKVTWGPAENAVPDQSTKLARYGAQLEGDLTFLGTGRTVRTPAGSGTSLVSYPSYQCSTLNNATTLVYKPNGSAQISNGLYSNNSISSTTYQAVTYGISGSEALIETLSLSAATPNLGINVGAGNRILTFTSTGAAFVGNGRTITFPTVAGPSLANWFGFQSSTGNSATSIVVKPSGTGTIANTLYSNNSTSTTIYQAVSYGMTATEALIESVSLGTTTLPVGINVGAGTRIATFKTTGINLLAGSKDIGSLIGWSGGLTNWGGSNAATYSTTAGVNVDTISAATTIATYLTATYDANKIEDMIRPLWCMLSFLVKNLQDKKVI